MGGGHNGAKTANFDDFWGVVTIATAGAPDPKLTLCGKFNCETREACEKCAHILYNRVTMKILHGLHKTSIFRGAVAIATADTPNSTYECLTNSNVNRLEHVKSVQKQFGRQNGAKTAKFDHFGGVVAIATADTPDLEL